MYRLIRFSDTADSLKQKVSDREFWQQPLTHRYLETAGEGGPWGMALLASYMLNKESDETLAHYLSEKVFVGNKGTSMDPDPEDVKGFETFIERYKKGIAIEKAALENLIV